MPIFLIFLGIAFMLLAWQNNQTLFVAQVGVDLSGGFLKWLGAIMLVGAVGFIPAMRDFSRGILGLILLSFILKNGSSLVTQAAALFDGSAPSAEAATSGPSFNVQEDKTQVSVLSQSGTNESGLSIDPLSYDF
jgi:hypothetical protein